MLQPKDIIYGFNLNSPIFMVSSFAISSTLIENTRFTYSLGEWMDSNEVIALRNTVCNEDIVTDVRFLYKGPLRVYQDVDSDVLVCHKGWKFFTDLDQAETTVRSVIQERERELNEELKKLQDLHIQVNRGGLLVLPRLTEEKQNEPQSKI